MAFDTARLLAHKYSDSFLELYTYPYTLNLTYITSSWSSTTIETWSLISNQWLRGLDAGLQLNMKCISSVDEDVLGKWMDNGGTV